MNRLERVRQIVDSILRDVADPEDRRCGFVHLYGVSLTATLLARERGLDPDLAAVAGMLHDLVSYESGDPADHGPRSSRRARELLRDVDGFTVEEIDAICSAVAHHSDKAGEHGPFEELLKDADVLQHYLYNTRLAPQRGHEDRRARLLEALPALDTPE
ncbi:MAG: HD domain-containing protein [Candidatus Bipolaricaulota bacterium]|nr:MAG: HD domain-containing protein [Candidatus Bipolaricaulota bacterium]